MHGFGARFFELSRAGRGGRAGRDDVVDEYARGRLNISALTLGANPEDAPHVPVPLSRR